MTRRSRTRIGERSSSGWRSRCRCSSVSERWSWTWGGCTWRSGSCRTVPMPRRWPARPSAPAATARVPRAAATNLANSNSKDGRSGVTLCGRGAPGLSPCPSDPPGISPDQDYVTARTSTVDPSNDDSGRLLNLLLAPLLDAAGADPALGADASAAFGALSSATTLNLTLSMCEFLRVGGVVGSGSVPTTVTEIYFREESTSKCVNPNNGFALPGGFGWINGAVRCNRAVQVPATSRSDPARRSTTTATSPPWSTNQTGSRSGLLAGRTDWAARTGCTTSTASPRSA